MQAGVGDKAGRYIGGINRGGGGMAGNFDIGSGGRYICVLDM